MVSNVDPINGKGIYTTVEVVCSDKMSGTFESFGPFKFWLPKKVFKAAHEISRHVHINRIFNIDDSLCQKFVKFFIKRTEPLKPFFVIVRGLREADVDVSVEILVEKHLVDRLNDAVQRLREMGVKVEVEVEE